ncbi:MAG: hypothetical protein II322_00465 [Alistipes sp.]|nr:hypothetical protein [Alistipes sp.]
MRKLNFLWALLFSALFVVGCSSDVTETDKPGPEPGPDDPTPTEKPEITLTQTEVTYETLTFEVTTTVAGTLGYAVVAEGYDAPKIDELYALNSAEVKDRLSITISDLNDNTNYTLYAVLRAGSQQSTPKTLKFTTPDDGVANPIVIHSATYDTISFSINIPGSYVFQCIDKAYLEYNNLTPEEYISATGIGIPSQGPISIDWMDGGVYGTYTMNVREDSDYYVIAAIAEGQTVVGDIFYKTTRTPKRPVSTAGLTTELTDITSTSVNIKTTPDSNVVDYFILVRDKAWSDSIVAGYGESMLATLVSYPSSGSWNLTGANEAVWSGLEPNTEYICHVVVNDNKGAQALSLVPFTTLEPSQAAPTVEASLTVAQENGYRTLNLNLYSADAASVKFAFNTKADVDDEREKYNYSDSDIAEKYGMELSAEQVEAIRTTGLTLKQEDLFPEVEYVAIISVKNAEKTETVKVTSATTPAKPVPARVESDLFTSLLGEWEVSYSLVQFNNVDVNIYNAKVTIAQGADDASANYYRSHNRLVIQGWPFNVESDGTHAAMPYYSPEDLKGLSNYWANNPQLALRDYGPKVFLEIGEGGVVTMPSSRDEYLYNWATDGTFYFFGADIENEFTAPASFPVTVSADGNTITIGACHSGEEFGYGIYRPAVFRYGTEAWALATGDIVLKRVK